MQYIQQKFLWRKSWLSQQKCLLADPMFVVCAHLVEGKKQAGKPHLKPESIKEKILDIDTVLMN